MSAELDAKVAALEARLGMLERMVAMMASTALRKTRDELGDIPDLATLSQEERGEVDAMMAEIINTIPRDEALEQVKASASNVILLIPQESVAEVMRNQTPAEALADVVGLGESAMHPTNKLMADFLVAIARRFDFSWADLGITAPFEVAR